MKEEWEICFYSFKDYLLDDCSENFNALKVNYDRLPSDKKRILELIDYKDPLIKLMKTGNRFTKAERKYMLLDYFDKELTIEELK